MFLNYKSVLFHLYLCVLCLICSLDKIAGQDYWYWREFNGCLKLHEEPTDWLNARNTCIREFADLVAPRTPKFLAAINEMTTGDQPLRVVFSETYTTVPTSQGKRSTLLPGPNGLEQLDRCGVWYTNGTNGIVDCNEQLPFVCYTTARTLACDTFSESYTLRPTPAPTHTFTPDPSCGEQSLGYELAEGTGKCYKFHPTGSVWLNSNRTCLEEGAHLAVANNPEETTILTALFARYPPKELEDTVTSYYYAAVGIYWEGAAWKTVNGQTLDALSYAEWTPGAPSSIFRLYPYVYMHRTDGLYNFAGLKASFICEKPAVARR